MFSICNSLLFKWMSKESQNFNLNTKNHEFGNGKRQKVSNI